MKTAILSTGNELIHGTITDTNSSWMARRFREENIDTHKIIIIGDSRQQLADALKTLWTEYELVVCTGGLGPTTDDITAAAAADALGEPLERKPEAEKQVQARFSRRSIPMAAINLKQADLPLSAHILENLNGTAPGFLIERGSCKSYFLPGVPDEMKAMFEQHVLPAATKGLTKITTARCTLFGIGESTVQERLMSIEIAFPTVTFSYRAAFPAITITVFGTNATDVASAHRQICQRLAPFVFTVESKSPAEVTGELLLQQQRTIATAESCTGGMISSALTDVAGASVYVRGAVVAYENRIKSEVLGVSEELLATRGAVSEEVVRAMAKGVQKLMRTDVAIATSGIAGPGGGTDDKPVGTVHIAVAIDDVIFHKKCLFKGYSRTKVKTATTWTALLMARSHLLETRLRETK